MKRPHGLIYAILIIVGILAVTLYARQQSSSILAGTSVKAQSLEPVADDASSSGKNDDVNRAESEKNTEVAPK